MSHIDFLAEGLRLQPDKVALAFRSETLTCGALEELTAEQIRWLERVGIEPSTPVVLLGDFSFATVSLLLALIARGAICIPLTPTSFRALGDQVDEAAPRYIVDATAAEIRLERRPGGEPNSHYRTLAGRKTPGLVLYTSGSTGRPKAVIHDFARLLDKFRKPRPSLVTLNFLLFDHWGGLNTLLHSLSSRSLIVFPEGRKPAEICELIEAHRIELLPATPTFLNMLLISRAFENHDMSSLKVISYGAEPMPANTLQRLREVFPSVEMRQTYGMIELGVMRAKSMASDSLWVKLGGENCELRVVDSILQVKSDSAMLGYLNAPSPFTDDGYFITGDMVEQQGEYLKILGRTSDLINVGGQKVYPAEVETVVLELPEVKDVVVYGERHVLAGKIVCADVIVMDGIDQAQLRLAIKRHCASKLQPFMVPVKVTFRADGLHTDRLKRRRDL